MMGLLALSHESALGKVARLPLRVVPSTAVVRVLSGPLRGKRWIAGSGIYRCWLGWYESDKQRVISRYVLPSTVFYDVGANVGFYSLLASMLVGTGRVFAFEPLPRNLSYLTRHIDLNGASNVDVRALAISDRNTVAKFSVEKTGYMGRLASEGEIQVPTTTLDSLLQDGSIVPPDYIKMDIEGAEHKALLGARECFERYRPTLFLATHGEEIREKCCQLLRSWGYNLSLIGEPTVDAAEIIAVPEGKHESANFQGVRSA